MAVNSRTKKSTEKFSATVFPVYVMTKSTVPASSFTVKSDTVRPSVGPFPSLSKMVPIPTASNMLSEGFEISESSMSKFSVASNKVSSLITMVTTCVAPETVPAGKVTEGPPVRTV